VAETVIDQADAAGVKEHVGLVEAMPF